MATYQGVGAISSAKGVKTEPTLEDIVAIFADQYVVAEATVERISAVTTVFAGWFCQGVFVRNGYVSPIRTRA